MKWNDWYGHRYQIHYSKAFWILKFREPQRMMEGMVLKSPSFHSQFHFQFMNPNRCISCFSSTLRASSSPLLRFRNPRLPSHFSVSASASTAKETDSLHLNSLSLGHTTRPDFPILHQVLVSLFIL